MSTPRFTQPMLALLAAALMSTASTGCGAQNNSSDYRTSGSSSASLSSSSLVGDWVCPTVNYNVVPVAGALTQTMSFRVCRSSTANSKFLIEGHSDSAEVCFFPAARTSSGSLSVIELPKCYDVSRGPVVVDFSTSGINYMLAATRANSPALATCMTSTSSCPPYAAGTLP